MVKDIWPRFYSLASLKAVIEKLTITVSEQEALKLRAEDRERTVDEEEWNIVLGRHKKTYY